MAHNTFALAARPSVHSPWRKPTGADPSICKPDGDHACGWLVARSRLNHVWLKLKSALPGYERYFVIPKWMGIVLTFLSVTVAWVFFASPDFETAMRVLSGMCGANGFSGDAVWSLKQVLLGGPLVVEVPGIFGTRTQILAQYGLLAFAALIVFFAPNSQQIVEGLIGHEQSLRVQSRLRAHWRKTAILAGFVFTLSFLSVGDLKEFVYFQF